MYIYYDIIHICIYRQMRHHCHPVREGIISRKHVYCMLGTTRQSPLIFRASCPCDYYDYNNHESEYDVYCSIILWLEVCTIAVIKILYDSRVAARRVILHSYMINSVYNEVVSKDNSKSQSNTPSCTISLLS